MTVNLLPNAITLGRLAAVPLIVWLLAQDHMTAAFWVFIAAGISDAVDGAIARRFHAQSELGGWLDPIADKALLVSTFIALGLSDQLPAWLVGLVVVRDLIILGGVGILTLIREKLTLQPLYVSKVNTLCQIILAGMVLAVEGPGVAVDFWVIPAILLVTLTTGWSLVAYVMRGLLILRIRRKRMVGSKGDMR